MDPVVIAGLRRFISDQHIRNLLRGNWVAMFDEHGVELPGIRGRVGVSAVGLDGAAIGMDLMEVQPGAGFPAHTHAGDHLIYVLSGTGLARIDEVEHILRAGDSVFVAAEQVHAFENPPANPEPFVIVAVGHPHKHLSAHDRMKLVDPRA